MSQWWDGIITTFWSLQTVVCNSMPPHLSITGMWESLVVLQIMTQKQFAKAVGNTLTSKLHDLKLYDVFFFFFPKSTVQAHTERA